MQLWDEYFDNPIWSSSVKILIVDDSTAMRMIVRKTLRLAGFTTLITIPLGVGFAIGIDRWRGRTSAGLNFVMIFSFVVPELLLAVALMFVFGITFEFPVVLVSLEIAGVLTPKRLASWRRWAIVLITIVAAVITPSGDPFSMLALAIPLYFFYEISIVLGKLLRRDK